MRKLIIILLGCTAILFAGYAGYRGYKIWKQSHFVSLARQFMAKSDYRNAFLSINQALRSNPRNLDAIRLMAELTEINRSPAAITWRSRVVELEPQSTDDRLALCRVAMAMRDFTTATNALEGVSGPGKNSFDYHSTAGLLWVSMGRMDDATHHFTQAARLQPTNMVPRLNLAVIGLKSTNTTVQAEARTTLQQLTTNATFRCQALRVLVADAMAQRQHTQAISLSRELVQQTNSTFADRLLQLDVLRTTSDPGYSTALAQSQAKAAQEAATVDEMGRWLLLRTSPGDTLAWLSTVSASIQTNLPAALLAAECRALTSEWNHLQTNLESQAWGDLEVVRHAYLARALRGQDLASSSKTEWQLALKEANNQKSTLTELLRLAAQWKWENEGEEILWTIVNRYPDEKWALDALSRVLYASGRTRSLMTLYSQLSKANPSDLAAKNNLAITALLLEAQEVKPHDLAREVYEKSPTNASYASTYAFSLFVQEKPAEALKVMQKLEPRDLENPSIAGYYGLILKATGDNEKAKAYLGWASKVPALPEEKKLFETNPKGIEILQPN